VLVCLAAYKMLQDSPLELLIAIARVKKLKPSSEDLLTVQVAQCDDIRSLRGVTFKDAIDPVLFATITVQAYEVFLKHTGLETLRVSSCC